MEFNEIKSYEEAFIAGYGDGGFRMGENRFEGSMLITPAGFYPWDVQVKEEINLKNLDPILRAPNVELLIVGTGESLFFLNKVCVF